MRDTEIPKAADIMTRDVVALRPQMRTLDAMRIFVEERISGAPVVDESRRLVGIVSVYDCLRVLTAGQFSDESQEENEPVEAIMTRDVVSIGPGLDLFSIAHKFLERPVRRLPVVDEGRVVGMVSRRDVLAGVERMRQQMRKPPGAAEKKPPALYLSASDPEGDEINSRLSGRNDSD